MEYIKFLQPISQRICSLHGKVNCGSRYVDKYLIPSTTFFISSAPSRLNSQWNSAQMPQAVTATIIKRHYSEGAKPMRLKLMNFNMIVWPSIIKTLKNWINTALIVRPYLDPDFTLDSFMQGSKQAAEVVSNYLAQGNFEELESLLTPQCLKEIKDNLAVLNATQRHELAIKKEDIYFTFPYELGIIFDDQKGGKENLKRYVEVTVVHHVLRGHSEMIERGEPIPLNIGVLPEYRDKIFILNYRFIRNYTKGVTDNWTLNVVNHFKPIEQAD